MPTKPLPIYWHADRDRWRVHLPDGRKVTLKREDGTPFAHCARWHPDLLKTARALLEAEPSPKMGLGPFAPDTFNAYGRRYFSSAKFDKLAPTTKRARRHAVEQFLADHGVKRVTKLERRHVRAMLDDVTGQPGRARNLLTTIRSLIAPAIEDGLLVDPTAGFARPALSKAGWLDWPEEIIAQYEAYFPIGHDARLALGLGLYTAQRKSDVVRMGRQHVKAGWLSVKQSKTGTALRIPICPELQALLDRVPPDRLTFLVTSRGAPFTANGFGHRFKLWCREAGLPPGYSFHGLRKACLRRLAEAERDQLDLMAISGHKSPAEVQRYIEAAEQAQRASRAISRTESFPTTDSGFPREKKL